MCHNIREERYDNHILYNGTAACEEGIMRKIKIEELQELILKRDAEEQILLEDCLFENMDLSGWDLHGIVFDRSDFRNVNLAGANLSGCTARNAFFGDTSLRGANLTEAVLCSADFRGCALSNADISGADMHASALFKADLTGIKTNQNTKFFHMRCPEKGAFIGWKVCYGRRVVMLLIPADAKRVQGTHEEVRCEKAKVLTIKSIDLTEQFEEAHSYVDENFIYRRGQMVYAGNFNPERFVDSAGGIHVWLSREEAVAYLG